MNLVFFINTLNKPRKFNEYLNKTPLHLRDGEGAGLSIVLTPTEAKGCAEFCKKMGIGYGWIGSIDNKFEVIRAPIDHLKDNHDSKNSKIHSQ